MSDTNSRLPRMASAHREREERPTRPSVRPGSRTQPREYGPGTREVTPAQRHGHERNHRRAQPKGRHPADAWSISMRTSKGPHFTASPIDLRLRYITAGCKPDGTIPDPFVGTGSTGFAAIWPGHRLACLTAERLAPAVVDPEATCVPDRTRHHGYAYRYGYPGARVSSDRQIRRRVRQIHEAGTQPMMFVDDNQFRRPLGGDPRRCARQHRSEFAPPARPRPCSGPACGPHLARPHRWPYLIENVAAHEVRGSRDRNSEKRMGPGRHPRPRHTERSKHRE